MSTVRTRSRSIPFLLTLALWFAVTGAANAEASAPASTETVLVAHPADPYYPLALEIVEHEGLSLVPTLEDALALNPTFLLWVIAPKRLSDETLVEFALTLEAHPLTPSTGILSGATLEDARALWQRAGQVRRDRVVAVNAENPSAGIPAGIHLFEGGQERTLPLSLETLVDSLRNADYLTFTGHGGATYLRIDETTALRPNAIPPLPAAVVATGSCNTFRLWTENSLALAFVARGAAAYAGFAYSPNEGFLIGEFDGLPMRYTWPEFPIGHVVQVQNRGALQGFAQFPYYFLLGDPRIALGGEPLYQLIETHKDEQRLTLRYTGAPSGVIPVRVAGGAAYDYVDIPGASQTWKRAPFYNARLQMVNLGDDKLILFRHEGGDFTLELRRRPSPAWVVADVIVDSLDTTLLFLHEGGGAIIFFILGLLALLPTFRLVRQRVVSRRALAAAFLTGLSFAVLHGLYILIRLERITITSKPVHFHPASPAATLLLVGCGALLFLSAWSWKGRVLAVLVAAMASLAPAVLLLGIFAIANQLLIAPHLGVPLWNNHLGLQPLIAFALEALLFVLTFALVNRIVQSKSKETTNP